MPVFPFLKIIFKFIIYIFLTNALLCTLSDVNIDNKRLSLSCGYSEIFQIKSANMHYKINSNEIC